MRFILQMQPWFGNEEREALNAYMQEDGWLTEFRNTNEFEQRIAEFTGSKHCIVVNNGTISLTLMAMAAGIKAGDEVIVPNYTMIATPNSIKMVGATPVFVDVEPETLCMDIESARKAITSKTKALLFVNANGRIPKSGVATFQALCKETGIIFLEDSAQSLGSFYEDGKHQGTASLAGSLSFSAPKIISTGQGGAIITSDDDMATKLRKLKDFGRSGGGNDVHDSIGFNFKFTEMQAVIGIEQMKKLPWRIERKKTIYRLYRERLAHISQVKFFEQDLDHTTPWFIDTTVERRDELQEYLKEAQVGTRVMYPPISKQFAYNLDVDCPVSEHIGKHGLWLPSAAQLSDEEIEYVTDKIISFYNE